jgi:predicted NodU family carbamoyl transferase
MRFRYVRHCTLSELRTTGGIKQVGTHNRSESGRGALVTFYVHPAHTDTGIEVQGTDYQSKLSPETEVIYCEISVQAYC